MFRSGRCVNCSVLSDESNDSQIALDPLTLQRPSWPYPGPPLRRCLGKYSVCSFCSGSYLRYCFTRPSANGCTNDKKACSSSVIDADNPSSSLMSSALAITWLDILSLPCRFRGNTHTPSSAWLYRFGRDYLRQSSFVYDQDHCSRYNYHPLRLLMVFVL